MMLGNIAAMFIVLIIVSIAVWKGLDFYTHHGERIVVPDVRGKLESDAYYALSQLGLTGVVVDSAYNRQMPAGSVVDQTPHGGNEVKSGREIYLVVNAASTPTLTLPDIADNSSLREAQAKLTAIGFKLGPVEYVNGDRDWVYGVKCRDRNIYAGEQAPLDVPLVLQVGRGVSDLEELVEEDGEEEEFVEEIIAPDGTD